MFKVLITGSSHPHKKAEADFLRGIADVIVNGSKERAVLLKLVEDVHAIMTDTDRIDREVFDKARELKVVVEYGIGVDNIDVEAATGKGILVCNVPDAYIREVAEHTVALALCMGREIVRMNSDVRQNRIWNFNLYKPIKMQDKVYGLIGFGRTAREVAKLIKPLCLGVLVYDPLIDETEIRKQDVEPSDIGPLLRRSDVISIHVPLSDDTRGMVGKRELEMMKASAILINVSRGGIVDEGELYAALKNKKIRGAALDVLADEPVDTYNLATLENIILTPHAAWKSEEAPYNLEMAAAREVKNVLEGKPPRNLVNRAVRMKTIR